MGSLGVRHDWVTSLSLFTFMHWRRKWQPTPVFLPGESQGGRSLVGCRLWGRTESDTTERLGSSSSRLPLSESVTGEQIGEPRPSDTRGWERLCCWNHWEQTGLFQGFLVPHQLLPSCRSVPKKHSHNCRLASPRQQDIMNHTHQQKITLFSRNPKPRQKKEK